MRLRILHVVPSYLPATRYGGPIQSVHGLCRALAQAGHEVSVFTTTIDGQGSSDVPLGRPVEMDGVQIWYFPSPILRRLYWAPRMKRALREQVSQFDLVHLHSVFLWPTWAAAREARRVGVPYLVAPRGMLVKELLRRKSRWLKTAWIRLIERRNLKQAAGIHVTAPIEQAEIEEFGFNLPRFYYVPNGIDEIDVLALVEAHRGLQPDGPYVLFLSRINWKKGLDRLVQAWRLVPDKLLVVAGNDEDNYRAEVERLARAEGVADRIRFIGAVEGSDKWLLYQNADLFVLPSYSENFGIVVLEAMAMGCPVVVTPEVGLAETVAEADCGRVVDGEPEALAAAINELLANEPLRRALGRRGQDAANSQFLWPSVAREMEVVYAGLIKGERSVESELCHLGTSPK
jgi:glycosyltransferase involved in cell wall biosynthesis